MFFVLKSNKKGIRLIIDARETNECHRRPPRAFWGSGSAIGDLQIDSSVGSFAEVEVPLPGGRITMKEEFQRLDGATGDVSDAFYQFSVEHMAEWFGLDDAVCPHEIGLDGPNEKFFFCFAGMPQGWTWALFFCQAPVWWCGERA